MAGEVRDAISTNFCTLIVSTLRFIAVVAILVAFFSTSGEGGMTHAEVQAGLWFFAAYVVLSLIGTQLISHKNFDEKESLRS